jgi:hypothetical protein
MLAHSKKSASVANITKTVERILIHKDILVGSMKP